jgi:hypothetical protein
VGRPKKNNKVALRTYNISIENADRLDEIKLKGENQDDVITRLLSEYELGKDSENYKHLWKDTLETVKDLRKKYLMSEKYLISERRQNNIYQNPLWINRVGYLQMPYIF